MLMYFLTKDILYDQRDKNKRQLVLSKTVLSLYTSYILLQTRYNPTEMSAWTVEIA